MRRILLALLLLLVAAEAVGARTVGPAASAPTISAETLLAAGVPWATVQQVAGGTWWPEPPSFDSRVYQGDPNPRTAVTQVYSKVGGNGRISISLYAYASRAQGSLYVNYATLVGDVIDRERPAIGEGHAFYRTVLPDKRHATRFYFFRGPVAAAIQVEDADWSPSRIERLARPIDDRIRELLAGKLRPPAIPSARLALLPSAAAAPGPVLGTALVPAEAWATIVHNGNLLPLRNTLVESGNETFPFRRYLRQGSRREVLETTLFVFPSPGAASSFVAPFRAGVSRNPKTALDPGETGNDSAFRYEFENYELQFAAGRFVGDVFCWAPFSAKPSGACETAARRLAERWYAELSRTS
jgi:hypothetical protein